MNITELEQYNIDDAVKFNDQLNPRLWQGQKMRPEVRKQLIAIAKDFREFIGIEDLDVEDITVSGSNASYTYTPNSDIDLHLIVRKPEQCSEILDELFQAKKSQYNQEHDIKIGEFPVELYVQNAAEKHISQGIYSIVKDDWVSIPRRQRATVDDISTRSKYEDLQQRIESAIKSQDEQMMKTLWTKIRELRKAGLDRSGELGPENLAFKMLRNQGVLKNLKDAITRAHDQQLSIKEAQPRPKIRYGFKEDVSSNPNGVSPTTRMFLSEKDPNQQEAILRDFVEFCSQQLKLKSLPHLKIHRSADWSKKNHTFGRYTHEKNLLEICIAERHLMDVLRTLAHELVHRHQHEKGPVDHDAGRDGSREENQANAVAGVLMRRYAKKHPEYFGEEYSDVDLREDREPITEVSMAPGTLRAWASTPEAAKVRMGFEAEMVFLGVKAFKDESISSWEDINSQMSDYFSDEEIRDVMSELQDGFSNYVEREIADWKDRHEEDAIREFITNNLENDIQEKIQELQADEDDDKDYREQAIDEIVDEFGYLRKYRGYAQEALEDAGLPSESDFDIEDYLRDRGIYRLSDLVEQFDLDGSGDVGELASRLQQVVGARVEVGGYHSGSSRNWKLEPDASIRDNPLGNESGLELITPTPPMFLEESLTKLRNLIQWARDGNAETNSSTGLHINISIDGVDSNDIDYLKLLLLSGNEYVMQQFDRLGNEYTKNILGSVRDTTRMPPEKLVEIFDNIRQGLLKIAQQKIFEINPVDRYASINLRQHHESSYFEVRSIGNNYLDPEQFASVENAILRFSRALVIAASPQLYRKEYLKKLYQLLSQHQPQGIVTLFSQYSVGEIDKQELINRWVLASSQREYHGKRSEQELRQFYTKQTETPRKFKVNYSFAKGSRKIGVRYIEANTPQEAIQQAVLTLDPQNFYWVDGTNITSDSVTSTVTEQSGYIPTAKQANDPRFKMALTVDVRPGETGRQANKLKLKTNAQGKPQLLHTRLRNELKEHMKMPTILNEVDMSPSSLERWANSSEAERVRMGFEAEMIFFNTGNLQNTHINDLDDIHDLLSGAMSHNDLLDGIANIRSGYEEYLNALTEEWDEKNLKHSLKEYIEEEYRDQIDDEVLAQLGSDYSQEEYDQMFARVVSNRALELINNEDPMIKTVREVYGAPDKDTIQISDFFEAQGYSTLEDIVKEFYRNVELSFADNTIDDQAKYLSKIIGNEVVPLNKYHEQQYSNDWVLEPDASISSGRNNLGLELVTPTPPPSLKESLSILEKVLASVRADDVAATNQTTGLHINLSIQGSGPIDYFKLIVLSGDQYVLEQFGRLSNSYATNVTRELKTKSLQPQAVNQILDTFRKNLDLLAMNQLKKRFGIDRYFSINQRNSGDNSYVEFRSIGGNYLEPTQWKNIKSAILRYARALVIASRPELYRQEYLKKVYQLLDRSRDNSVINLFQQFSAQLIDKKEFIGRWAEISSTRKLYGRASGEKIKSMVRRQGPQWYRVNVSVEPDTKKISSLKFEADSPEEAIRQAQEQVGEKFFYWVEGTQVTSQTI